MNTKTTVILNDLHCGSDVAIMSPDAVRKNGNRRENMNEDQKVLWDNWKELAKKWSGADCLIVNGDAVEGIQPRERATNTWSSDMSDQADDAVRLIKMFKAKKIFVVKGTPYHVREGGVHIEEQIARDLNAVPYRFQRSHDFLAINLSPEGSSTKRIFHVAHHLGNTSTWQYRGTPLSKAIAMLMLNERHFLKEGYKFFGIIRAHLHYSWYEESTSRIMMVCPAWQLATPFMYKKMPESPPDIGSVRLTIHQDGNHDYEKFIVPAGSHRPPLHQA